MNFYYWWNSLKKFYILVNSVADNIKLQKKLYLIKFLLFYKKMNSLNKDNLYFLKNIYSNHKEFTNQTLIKNKRINLEK
jgi:hypothetical protein